MPVKKRRKGNRYPLLLYKRAMERLWKATLVLGLLLAGIWWQALVGTILPIKPPNDSYVFIAAIIVLLFTLFAMLARYMSFVQANADHLRVVTPFLRLKISYHRIRIVRFAEFHKLFPPQDFSWAEERFLEPYIRETVVVVDLDDYPLPYSFLRLFLPTQMFTPKGTGFVFVVSDWIELSTEIDSFRGAWMENRKLLA